MNKQEFLAGLRKGQDDIEERLSFMQKRDFDRDYGRYIFR